MERQQQRQRQEQQQQERERRGKILDLGCGVLCLGERACGSCDVQYVAWMARGPTELDHTGTAKEAWAGSRRNNESACIDVKSIGRRAVHGQTDVMEGETQEQPKRLG